MSVYMRTLRALVNIAINSGVFEYVNYPFKKYTIKSKPTALSVANMDELQRYFALEVDYKDSLHWDIGRLILLLRGINFTDLKVVLRTIGLSTTDQKPVSYTLWRIYL
jgi:integrase/recombinase XerD